jgi:uncharacterized RDD family membrane protein YckC
MLRIVWKTTQKAFPGEYPGSQGSMAATEETPFEPELFGRASGPRAGFWRRFWGTTVDGIILGVIAAVLEATLKGAASSVLAGLAPFVYFTLFVGSGAGQSPGMRVLSVRVIDADGGGPIGYRRALIRAVGGYISAIPLSLGFLWMIWDKEKQCWHDKLAHDFVVPA